MQVDPDLRDLKAMLTRSRIRRSRERRLGVKTRLIAAGAPLPCFKFRFVSSPPFAKYGARALIAFFYQHSTRTDWPNKALSCKISAVGPTFPLTAPFHFDTHDAELPSPGDLNSDP
jgi:hypothetical protein